ncbi:Integrase zinc binding domain [Popillia japonica]|uniref:RNA-directed DNA polymerase n=1 Tax=Popillia japonica TaxID=7064 RepID=A0AAW1JGG1_POPJA
MQITEALIPRIKKAQDKDDQIKTIKEILCYKEYDDYFMRTDLLYKVVKDRELLVVPKDMQVEVIRSAHERGHFVCRKTRELIEQEYFIPGLQSKVERFITTCVPCIMVNRKAGKKEGYLQPIFKEAVPLHTYHLDHLGPLETTAKSYKHILAVLAVIDGFTKFVWLYPVKTTSTRETLSKLEIQKQVFGNPTQIVTDTGSAFTSSDLKLQQDYLDRMDRLNA